MKLIINKTFTLNTTTLLRRCGYHFVGRRQGEASFAKRAGSGRYPQFHIYVNQETENELVLNLHLDAKKPSYTGTYMHAGEYDTEVVKAEAERIKKIIATL